MFIFPLIYTARFELVASELMVLWTVNVRRWRTSACNAYGQAVSDFFPVILCNY